MKEDDCGMYLTLRSPSVDFVSSTRFSPLAIDCLLPGLTVIAFTTLEAEIGRR